MTNFFTGSLRWVLLIALTSVLPLADAQTNSYSNAGVYTNITPTGVNKATFKLWGAGGGGSLFITNQFPMVGGGGGGAFSSVTLDVQPGDTFVIVVGQRGSTNGALLGGAGSGNTVGGPPGFYNGFEGRSQGGQASSAFFITNNLLLMKAVAGGGGGAGRGADGGGGGQPGQTHFPAQGGQPGANGTGGFGSGTAGVNYNSSALTTGLSALNQADGNGGNGVAYSGGGGGGYGGGAGGTSDPMTSGSGGGGGGSYGTTVNFGAGIAPGNNFDPNYVGNAGMGGVPNAPGSDGLAVLIFISSPVPTVVSPALLADGSLRLSFTNVPGASFTAFGTTNISPVNWTSLGSATEISSGHFQYTDTQATNFPMRFYQIRSP